MWACRPVHILWHEREVVRTPLLTISLKRSHIPNDALQLHAHQKRLHPTPFQAALHTCKHHIACPQKNIMWLCVPMCASDARRGQHDKASHPNTGGSGASQARKAACLQESKEKMGCTGPSVCGSSVGEGEESSCQLVMVEGATILWLSRHPGCCWQCTVSILVVVNRNFVNTSVNKKHWLTKLDVDRRAVCANKCANNC